MARSADLAAAAFAGKLPGMVRGLAKLRDADKLGMSARLDVDEVAGIMAMLRALRPSSAGGHDPDYPDVDPVSGDEAETQPL